MTSPEQRQERRFSEPKQGTFWEVFEYSEPGEREYSKEYVAKRLKKHLLYSDIVNENSNASYDDPGRTSEQTQAVASYMRRERDHLRRSYSASLPDLIPKEKIIVLPPKEDHPAGEILSLQEKLGDHIPIYQLEMDKLTAEEQRELKDQIEQFVSITKSMASARDEQDPEFSNAIPDITHLSNLAVEVKDGKIMLRLFDTNYVLPVDNGLARMQHHMERCAYRLMYIEHHMLGRSMDDLAKDTFYINSGVIDFVKTRYPDIPNLTSKELYDAFNHAGCIAPWGNKSAVPDATVPATK